MTTSISAATTFNATADWFGYIASRWQDEKEYEDFDEYIEAARNKFGDKFVSLTNSPFCLTFLDDNKAKWDMRIRGLNIELLAHVSK